MTRWSILLLHRTRVMKSIFKHLSPQRSINNRFNQPTRNLKQTAKSCWDVESPFCQLSSSFHLPDGRKFPAVQHHGQPMKTFQLFILTRTEFFLYCHLTFLQNPKLKRSNGISWSTRDVKRGGGHSSYRVSGSSGVA